jgi:hypothetical protein
MGMLPALFRLYLKRILALVMSSQKAKSNGMTAAYSMTSGNVLSANLIIVEIFGVTAI